MKIVHKLFLSFLVFVLLIWVVGYLVVSSSQEALKRSIGENSAFLVAQTLDKIDRNIYSRIEEMQAYAKDLSLAKEAIVSNEEFDKIQNIQNYINTIDTDWKGKKDTPFIRNILNNELSNTLGKHLEFYKEKYGYAVLAEIYVTNKHGVIIASTGRTSDYLQADEEWYQKAVAEKEFSIGELEYDESSDTFASDIVVNLYDENANFVGILKGVLNIEEIIKIIEGMEEISDHETFGIHLVNRDGKAIYCKDHSIFKDLSEDLNLSKIDGNQGYFEERGPEGDKGDSLFSYALSKGYEAFEGFRWILLIEYQTEEIFAPVTNLRNNILLISVGVTIFAILMGILISRRISNPVTKLKNAAIEIGKGKLDTEIEVESHDEIGQLAGSFKEMIEDLKRTTTSIGHLNKEIFEHKRAKEILLERTYDLGERVKELDCLYGISKLIEKSDISLDKIVQGTTDLIPPSCQYPEITCARIILDGQEYKTEKFRETIWKLASGIMVHGKRIGAVEAYYLEEKPEIAEGPFLKEEKNLIDAISERLGKIIERKRIEEALRESEEKHKTLTENSLTGVHIHQDGKYVFVNDRFAEIHGYKPEEMLGKEYLTFIHPDQRELVEQRASQRLEGKAVPQCYETKRLRKDGKTIWCEIMVTHIQYRGSPAIMGNMIDISERKRVEEEKKTLQIRILQSEKMASIGQLAAGVAHEINNPTGFVSSNLKTLSDYQNDMFSLIKEYKKLIVDLKGAMAMAEYPGSIPEQMERIVTLESEVDINYILDDIPNLIKECQEGTERIKNIVIDLKDFAHPSEGKLQTTDINKGIESTLNIVWNELKYKATVTKDYGELPEVQCYPQQLNQVFMNILVNAAQAIEKQGEIRIATRALDGQVEIAISDTGSGIPKVNLSKIFDPFFTTREVGKGTGLGLNIAYNIIKDHKGAIDVESEVGKGTTFTIRIPVS